MNKKLLITGAAIALGYSAHAQTITSWTFETSAPVTSGPVLAEVGVGTASGGHVGTSTYSSPAGDGSAHSYSANTWAVGDYWQFTTSTATAASGVQVSWDQASSGTGPGSFQLFYSTDGTTYSPYGSAYSVLINGSPNPTFNATTYNAVFHYSVDLSSILGLDSDALASFRLVDASTTSAAGGTTAAGGTDRVDNFTVSAVPEPSVVGLLSMSGIAAAGFLRRKK